MDVDKSPEDVNFGVDARAGIILNYTLRTFKVKQDMWSKMISQEDYMMTINNFLNKPEVRILLISSTSAGLLIPANTFPESFKTKTIYFIKRQAELITKEDNFKTIVMCGEMSIIPLDQLTNMVDKFGSGGEVEDYIKWLATASFDDLETLHKENTKADILVENQLRPPLDMVTVDQERELHKLK